MERTLAPQPPTPPPPPATGSHPETFRSNYLNAFSQIFNDSLNVNCICKTTVHSSIKQTFKLNKLNPFDNQDFMSDDDDDDDADTEQYSDEIRNLIRTQQSIESNLLSQVEQKLTELDLLAPNDSRILKSQCDCSCFDNLRLVYNQLKNSFRSSANLDECIRVFEQKWCSFKFLSSDPSRCCDYYGTTVFHYAASDNSYELLKILLAKCPRGVECLDAKGLTPLMRAAQRNNYEIIEYLLNKTNSDLNGSARSTYTPLWFTVSNGFTDLARLLLDYNTSPSIVDRNVSYPYLDETQHNASSIYMFSPLRASVVYFKFQIMALLLQYGANVYELFGAVSLDADEPFSRLTNEDYVNSLKFFQRQLNSKSHENEKYLNYLNCFIENKNIYRRMMIEFVKSVYDKIRQNTNVMHRLEQFLQVFARNSIYSVIASTKRIDYDLALDEYVEIVNEFLDSINLFINSEQLVSLNDASSLFQIVSQRPNYYKELFEYATYLMRRFYRPSTLQEMCRFKIRKMLFRKIDVSNVKYTREFLKMNHLEIILTRCGLPLHLTAFVLYKS